MSSGTDFPSPTSGLPLHGPKQETGATQVNDYLGNEIAPTPVTIPGAATTVVGPDAFAAPAVVGVLTTYAREDHDHGLPSAPAVPASAAPALTLGTANSAGADTGHFFPPNSTIAAFDATVPVSQAMGDAAATGAAGVAARRDHKHGMPSFATPAIVLGTAAAAGAAATAMRTDATIVAFDVTVPVTQNFGDAAATGAAIVSARRDHVHGMPATPAGQPPYPLNVVGQAQWYNPPGVTFAGATGVAGVGLNNLVAIPVFLPASAVISGVGLWVASAVTSAACRIGLYADSAGKPSGAALFDSGSIACATTGAKNANPAYTVLTTGWYWLAYVPQGAEANTGTVTAGSTSVIYIPATRGTSQPTAAPSVLPITTKHNGTVSGALPTWVFTAGQAGINNLPDLVYKLT